jgi:predicted PurR-regulated permease PerM
MSGAPLCNRAAHFDRPIVWAAGAWRAAARLHPVIVIFCFLYGAFLFGVVGVIMAVPVALIVKITLALLYDEQAKDALASE